MPDHVHVVIQFPPKQSISGLVHQIKGVSSHFVHEQLPGNEIFRWQEGYGVFSLGRNQLKHVLAYVQNQKRHHASGKTWPQWEETDEEYIPPDDK